MRDSNTSPVTIRPYRPEDSGPLARLAALEERAVPEHPLLVAEAGGRLLAAVSRSTGEVVADPFEPTAHLVAVLRSTP